VFSISTSGLTLPATIRVTSVPTGAGGVSFNSNLFLRVNGCTYNRCSNPSSNDATLTFKATAGNTYDVVLWGSTAQPVGETTISITQGMSVTPHT
jgi:hypothetical protein